MKEKEIVVNKEYPYLSNTKAPVQLLGLAPLYNSFCDHVSAQRLTMWSNHFPQAQLMVGCDFPRVYTGYENIIGQYEYDPSARDQDVQILAVIPKFIKNTGANPILSNPFYTIVYREAGPGDPATKRVGYFQIEKDCMRTDNYGYEFKRMNLNLLNEGNLIPKDVKFLTSPAHDGNKYNLGVNLNIAYLDIPEVTEDAFVISESAAKKMASTGYGTRTFKILPNQVPVGLYSTESEYKFIPDVGEFVRDDGILCAIRTPSEASVVYDTTPENLHKVQYLHDKILYAPAGAEIVDIDVTINRKCKVKTPKELFAQLEKYRSAVDVYNLRVWEAYRRAVSEGRKLTPAFRSLVTRCLASLIMDDQQVPGLNKRIPLTAKKNKEQIEFFYVTVKYKYNKPVARGFKQTSLSGDKGTISAIWPDEYMPVDEYGFRADVIGASVSIFNRMNPSCWYAIFVGRMNEFVRRQVAELAKTSIDAAFNHLIQYLTDCNENYGALVNNSCPNPKSREKFIQEVIKDGIYTQITPFLKGIDEAWALRMAEKYGVKTSPVTYSKVFPDGTVHKIVTKRPVLIGPRYTFKLYKEPHQRSPGLGYVSQFKSPMKPNRAAKDQYPFSQVAIRLGEDEIRNIVMTAGAETAAHIIGAYANSPAGVTNLATHLLRDEKPSQLEHIDLTLPELIQNNVIIGVTKHIFATIGVNIAPSEVEVKAIMSDKDAATATEDVEEVSSLGEVKE